MIGQILTDSEIQKLVPCQMSSVAPIMAATPVEKMAAKPSLLSNRDP